MEEGLKHLLLRPEGPAYYSPGRSEAEAWVLSKKHRVLKGRHKLVLKKLKRKRDI